MVQPYGKQDRDSVVAYEILTHSMLGYRQSHSVYHHVNLILKRPRASLKENTAHCQLL